jgi:hypothetical protein
MGNQDGLLSRGGAGLRVRKPPSGLTSELEQLEDQEALGARAHRVLPLKTSSPPSIPRQSKQPLQPGLPSLATQRRHPIPVTGVEIDMASGLIGPIPVRRRSRCRQAGPRARSRPSEVYSGSALSHLWPDAVRSAPHQIRRAASDGTQGQPPLHRAHLPASPSGAPPVRR